MNKKLLLCLGLSMVIAACSEPEKKEDPTDDSGAFTQSIDETIRPANPITSETWTSWQVQDLKANSLIPTSASIFTSVFRQGTLVATSPDITRDATSKLSAEGKGVLAHTLRNCLLKSPFSTSNTDGNNSRLIEGSLNVGDANEGPSCSIGLSETHKTSQKVTARNSETETYNSNTVSVVTMSVKDPNLVLKSGIQSATKTLSAVGTYIRFHNSPYAYASAKVIVTGSFSVKLQTGEAVNGSIAGEANLGGNYSSQYLIESTTSKGDVRFVIKRKGTKVRYILNGKEIAASAVPEFLNLVKDY